jgi:hypothetical protein
VAEVHLAEGEVQQRHDCAQKLNRSMIAWQKLFCPSDEPALDRSILASRRASTRNPKRMVRRSSVTLSPAVRELRRAPAVWVRRSGGAGPVAAAWRG